VTNYADRVTRGERMDMDRLQMRVKVLFDVLPYLEERGHHLIREGEGAPQLDLGTIYSAIGMADELVEVLEREKARRNLHDDAVRIPIDDAVTLEKFVREVLRRLEADGHLAGNGDLARAHDVMAAALATALMS